MSRLPIADRELRVRARKAATHGMRVWVVLLAALIAFVVYGVVQVTRTTAQGRVVFLTLSSLAFLFSLFEGLRQTVDCLSEEKREGTMGLLFLTDLKGYDVVLGKLASASLNTVYALLGAAPVLGLSLLMGGVTGNEFARMVVLLVNTLFFGLALGLWASSQSRDHGKAWTAALGMLVLIGLIVPALAWVPWSLNVQTEQMRFLFRALAHVMIGVSPAGGFLLEFNRSGPPAPGFWTCLGCAHATAWCFLWRASRHLPTSWQEAPLDVASLPVPAAPAPAEADRSARDGLVPAANATPAFRAEERRRSLLDKGPVVWLALRRTHGPRPVWFLAGLGAVWALLGVAYSDFASFGVFMMFLTKLALRIWVAVQASRFFAEARKNGALELLLSTPLTAREVVRGQWRALGRLFLGPVLLLAAVEVMVISTGHSLGMRWTGLGAEFSLLASFYGLAFPLHLAALATVSMWLALRLRRPNQAAGLSVLCVYVLPGILVCLSPLMIVVDLVLLLVARDRLERGLRRIAERL